MAACESPRNILVDNKPLPEIPSFLGPLSPSWDQIAAMKPLQKSSFAEIFGDLLFKEQHQPESYSSSSAFSSSAASLYSGDSSASSSSSSSAASSSDTEADMEMFTKSPGSESSDVDPEEMMMIGDLGMEERAAAVVCRRRLYAEKRCSEWKRSKMIRAAFPPPISCIGRSGKPWVLFKSYREDGRFILKEIRIPTQEFMHACRKDGRLKLHIIQSDDEIPDDDDEDDEYDEEIDDEDDDDDDAESI